MKEAAKDKMKAFRLWMKRRTSENRAKTKETPETRSRQRRRCPPAISSVKIWNKTCNVTKKLLFHLAKFYRKETTEKIKDAASGDIRTNSTETDTTWTEYSSSLLNPIDVTADEEELNWPSNIDQRASESAVTLHEVEAAIKRAKNGKAAPHQPDLLKNDLYKWGKPLTSDLLTDVFQMGYNYGKTPEERGKLHHI